MWISINGIMHETNNLVTTCEYDSQNTLPVFPHYRFSILIVKLLVQNETMLLMTEPFSRILMGSEF